MMSHCFSLLLLAYLVWRRPVAGMLVGILEGMWLLWPLYGLPELLSFNVHLTLALTCLFSWRQDDRPHSMGLALAGTVALGLLYQSAPAAPETPTAVLGGILCGELVAATWTAGRLVYQGLGDDRGVRLPRFLRRMLWALGHLNAPLGTGGNGIVRASDARGSPVPEKT